MKKYLSYPFLIYLKELAKLQLLKNKPLIIGITGSAGKTSLRNAIFAILKDRFQVKMSIKANSETGIPLNILGIEPQDYSKLDWLRMALLVPIKLLNNWEKFQIYIAEMGIDSPYPPKNMEYLLTIVKPKIGVYLSALPVHSEFFDQLIPKSISDSTKRRELITDLIAQEKGKLIQSLPEDGTAILNLDDPRVSQFKNKTLAKSISFSTKNQADITVEKIKPSINGFEMLVKEGKRSAKLNLKLILDEHYAQTFMAAICVGRALNIKLSECIKSLEKNFFLPRGRMTKIPGIKNSTILDSSYNASRETMVSALKLLDKVAPERKIAIIGDMRELGEIGEHEHREVAKAVTKTADQVIAVGPLMKKWLAPELLSLGFPKDNLHIQISPFKAAETAKKIVHEGDTVLVKGSQNNIFLEIVVKALMKDKSQANVLLCRRGEFWDQKRKSLEVIS